MKKSKIIFLCLLASNLLVSAHAFGKMKSSQAVVAKTSENDLKTSAEVLGPMDVIEIDAASDNLHVIHTAASANVFGFSHCIESKGLKAAQSHLKNWANSLPTISSCSLVEQKLDPSEAIKEDCLRYKEEIFFVKAEQVWRCNSPFLSVVRKTNKPTQLKYSSDGLKISVDHWMTKEMPLY